jgi:membrane fusion protein (multidrug efflux system)
VKHIPLQFVLVLDHVDAEKMNIYQGVNMYIPRLLTGAVATLLTAVFLTSCGNGSAENSKSSQNETKSDSSAIKQDSTKAAAAADSGDKTAEKKPGQTIEAVPVEVTTIKKGTISDYILLSANLETEKMTDVYSHIQGMVEQIFVQEGDKVSKNQVLAKLEANEYELAEERAKLNYMKQESDFKRLQEMYEKDLLSKEEFEQAKFTSEGLKVDWEQAKLNLSYTRITAPITGVVGDRMIKLGDRINPTDKLFTVINTDEMIAVVYAPEKELGIIQKNQPAYISSDNIRGERFNGWIKRISPVVDPQSGTFKVTIGVRNEANKLRAGMFVNTHIVTATHVDAILIPKTAIVYENETMNVFVVRDSIAHKITLDVGFQDHEKVEALSEIKEGDKVIVVGQAGLKDKTRVEIVSERENIFAIRKDIGYYNES